MGDRGKCHICGGLLIIGGPDDCPVNHKIPEEDKLVAIHEIVLGSGTVIPKGTECCIEAIGDKNVRFWWWNEATHKVEKNTVGLKHFHEEVSA